MEEVFFDAGSPGGFGGPQSVQQAMNDLGYRFKLNDVKEWLHNEQSYARHYPIKTWTFRRRKIISYGILDLVEIDLLDKFIRRKFCIGINKIFYLFRFFSPENQKS